MDGIQGGSVCVSATMSVDVIETACGFYIRKSLVDLCSYMLKL